MIRPRRSKAAAPPPAPRPAAAQEEARRRFVTPEGVDLRLQVGSYSDRIVALLLDLAIIVGSLVILTILAALTALATRSQAPMGAIGIIWLLGSFLLRVGYFAGFELQGGATPGKRIMKLRVIARDGRAVTADAIIARNALRELEIFLPPSFLFAQAGGVDGALVTLGVLWTGVFVVFPLFNRDRLRLGDLAAGTMVVKMPKVRLLRDIAESAPTHVEGLVFTETQLDAYGIKELQVLEEVLRSGDRKTIAVVAAQIRNKIDWDGPGDLADRTFLNAYYAALRQRLETGLLFGRRREDKHHGQAQANT